MRKIIEQGISLLSYGQPSEAQKIFKMAVAVDKENPVVWYWLAQTMENPKHRTECLEKARRLALKDDSSLEQYRMALKQAKEPELVVYKISNGSKSLGDMCPICTVNIEQSDQIVICPKCKRAHHKECWFDNAFHCGNYACLGSGTIKNNQIIDNEPGTSRQALHINADDIPEQSPWQSRETKERSFMGGLRRQAQNFIMMRILDQIMMDAAQERARAQAATRQRLFDELLKAAERSRRQREERKRQAAIKKGQNAFWIGLIPGIMTSIATYHYTNSWSMAIYTATLIAATISSVVFNINLTESKDLSVILYRLLPATISGIAMFALFNWIEKGHYSVLFSMIIASIVGSLLQKKSMFQRRTTVFSLVMIFITIYLFMIYYYDI